ncbi:LysR substrate-binding domain-containing protein [Salipiger sp. PrR002]|uniref:LysR substrate-binding domain-containing protein n=1 Tax=Salipiger sp. PrR002 TaxID=2706489 RepID=UPI0013BC614D|nr:LysR substrate-binding domain-containing protein [Salipiger sp. PrR002]NDW02514.1 hypothetical protein [Salipiger sp. PrR002]NDW57950.1 hypothetical protein [Salipiger sp. PrR004]
MGADAGQLHRKLGRTPWKLVAAPEYLDRMGWPSSPQDLKALEQVRFAAPEHINTLQFKGMPEPLSLPTSVVAGNGEAARRLVLGSLGIARFSDFMVADDIHAGRLVELFAGELEAAPLDITALYLTPTAGLRRLAVFLDWVGGIL